MLMYSTAWSMTSSGVPIISSRGRARAMPTKMRNTPLIRLVRMAVCTVSDRSLRWPAPKYRATSTLTPMDRPMNKLVISWMRALVDPTAARAEGPTNCPTTMMSAALKSSCRMPERARGMANFTIFPSRGPFVMSISKELRRRPARKGSFTVFMPP